MAARIRYGHAVSGGVVNYLSPSAITSADPKSEGGCLRRWWWKYVQKQAEPQRKSQAVGEEMHAQLEAYLRGGGLVLGALALSGKHLLPEPGPDLLIEHDIGGGVHGVQNDPWQTASLRVSGIPMIGMIDWGHGRGQWIDNSGTLRDEAPDTIELGDHKSTISLNYAKTADTLGHTVQMLSYAKWALTRMPTLQNVRLSHIYYVTGKRQPAEKVTLLLPRPEIDRRWEYVEGVARVLRDTAKLDNEDAVSANTSSCGAYGGCPHREYCQASKAAQPTLTQIFGTGGANSLLAKFTEPVAKEPAQMSLIDKLKVKAADPATAAQTSVGALLATPAVATAPVVNLGLGGAVAALLADEQAAKAAQKPAPAAPPPYPIGFPGAVAAINATGLGFPALAGRALAGFMLLFPKADQAAIAVGNGRLTVLGTIEDPADLIAKAAEVVEYAKAIPAPIVAPAPVPLAGLLAPDAPASNPALAAEPVPGFSSPEAVAAHEAKRGRGRPKKDAASPPPTSAGFAAVQAALTPAPAPAQSIAIPATVVMYDPVQTAPIVAKHEPAPIQQAQPGLAIFVNAIPQTSPYESLAPYVDQLCAAMVAHFKLEGLVADIRCAPKSIDQLSFGAWKGALAAFARAQPPASGTYVAHSRGNEAIEIVVEALRPACTLYVVGVAS